MSNQKNRMNKEAIKILIRAVLTTAHVFARCLGEKKKLFVDQLGHFVRNSLSKSFRIVA